MNDNQEVKIGMTDGDDNQELQPICVRGIKSILIDRGVVAEIPTLQSGDIAYNKITGDKVLIIGWHPHHPVVIVEGTEIYTLPPTEITLEKPETPKQKYERERLEAAYDLYIFAMNFGGYKIVGFDKFVEHYSKVYIAIVEKTGYRK